MSFVGAIIDTELHRIRDRSKTVRSPGNSAARLKVYDERAEAGTLTPGQSKTAQDIRRVNAYQPSLGIMSDNGAEAGAYIVDETDTVDEIIRKQDAVKLARRKIAQALSGLTTYEAKLIGEAFGLWGQPLVPHSIIARSRHRSVVVIRKQIADVLVKCNFALTSVSA